MKSKRYITKLTKTLSIVKRWKKWNKKVEITLYNRWVVWLGIPSEGIVHFITEYLLVSRIKKQAKEEWIFLKDHT